MTNTIKPATRRRKLIGRLSSRKLGPGKVYPAEIRELYRDTSGNYILVVSGDNSDHYTQTVGLHDYIDFISTGAPKGYYKKMYESRQ